MSAAFLSGPKPRVFGHRGAAGLAPENTIPSFALALAMGADILELLPHQRGIEHLRDPLRLVLAVTPFNHPLNQIAHKVAPAIAAGALTTSGTAMALGTCV